MLGLATLPEIAVTGGMVLLAVVLLLLAIRST